MKRFLIIICLLMLSHFSPGQTGEVVYSYSKSKVKAQTNHFFTSETDTVIISQGTSDKPLPLIKTKNNKMNLKYDGKRKVYDFIGDENIVLAGIDFKSKMNPSFDIVMPDNTRLTWKKYNKKMWTYSMDGKEIISFSFKKSVDPKLTIRFNAGFIPAMEYAVIASQYRVLWHFYSSSLYPAHIGAAALRTLVL